MKNIIKFILWVFRIQPEIINPKLWSLTVSYDYLCHILGKNVPYFQEPETDKVIPSLPYNSFPFKEKDKTFCFLKDGLIFETNNNNFRFVYTVLQDSMNTIHGKNLKEVNPEMFEEVYDEIQFGKQLKKVRFKEQPVNKYGKYRTKLIIKLLKYNIKQLNKILVPKAAFEQQILLKLAMTPWAAELRRKATNGEVDTQYAFSAETKELVVIGKNLGYSNEEIEEAAKEFLLTR